MKSWKIAVPVLMLMCLASVASAQMTQSTAAPMKGHFTISGVGGLTVPVGKLSEDFAITTDNAWSLQQGLGWDAGGAVDYFISDQIALGADLTYGASKNKDDLKDDTGAVIPGAEIKAKTLAFGIHGKWYMPMGGGKIMPWLGLGAAMYNRKVEVSEGGVTVEFKDNKFGGNAGVGVDYMMTEAVSLGINGAFHLTGKFEDTEDVGGFQVPLNTDDWNYIAFNAALTFHIPTGGAGGGMMK